MLNRLPAEANARVLFVHVTANSRVEYRKHVRFAEAADGQSFDGYFFWQSTPKDASKSMKADLSKSEKNFYFDLGRDMTLDPKPSRMKRGFLMASRMICSLPKLLLQARKIRPELIYTSQQWLDVQLGYLMSLLFRVPHVIHIAYPVGPWLGKVTLWVIKQSRFFFTTSDFVRRSVIENGIPQDRVFTIYNPAEPTRFSHTKDNGYLNEHFDIPQQSPVIIGIGRIDPQKGFQDLIEAMAVVIEQVPQARLLICGEPYSDPRYEKLLKQTVSDLNLNEHIVFAGQRSDIPQLLSSSQVFCLPTQNEAFGNVFTEAMLSQLPVVAYESGSAPEIVEQGYTGFLVEPGNVASLADRLLYLVKNPDIASCMGENGRIRVHQKFTMNVLLPRWLNLIRSFSKSTIPGDVSHRLTNFY